jgi:hypothetical protein
MLALPASLHRQSHDELRETVAQLPQRSPHEVLDSFGGDSKSLRKLKDWLSAANPVSSPAFGRLGDDVAGTQAPSLESEPYEISVSR